MQNETKETRLLREMCHPGPPAEGTDSQEELSPRQKRQNKGKPPVFLAVFPVPAVRGCVWRWLRAVTPIPRPREDLSVP